jgi:hypothetical protein
MKPLPLPLANDHGHRPLHNRYIRTGAFGRWGMAVINTYSRNKFLLTVSLVKLKHPYGGFRSEAAIIPGSEIG